jgi:hypothetical protein
MADRASSGPKSTNYDASFSGDDNSLSEVSVASQGSRKTNATNSSKKSRRSLGSNGSGSVIDGKAAEALTAGNEILEKRIIEVEKHNRVMEDLEERKLSIEERKVEILYW